jgi:DNA-binding NtrC family response regulator
MALILVVDDEADVRQLLKKTITHAGHEFAEAESSADALNVMEERPAAVVFTDIQMPGRDGRWLTIELRKRYPTTAVVLATWVTDVESTISLRFGVLSYLTKPFDLDAVRRALDMAVAWHDNAMAKGCEELEEQRLEQWLDSLNIV